MSFSAIARDIIDYEQGDLSALQTLELFGLLIREEAIGNLQGSYGRTAAALIENGYLNEAGDITQEGWNYIDEQADYTLAADEAAAQMHEED